MLCFSSPGLSAWFSLFVVCLIFRSSSRCNLFWLRQGHCGKGFIQSKLTGRCYAFLKGPLDPASAIMQCMEMDKNATLAKVTNNLEKAYVQTLCPTSECLININYKSIIGSSPGGNYSATSQDLKAPGKNDKFYDFLSALKMEFTAKFGGGVIYQHDQNQPGQDFPNAESEPYVSSGVLNTNDFL